jgi:5-oxoprolinase (ATP-hydrolysing) subunit A
MKWDINLDAGEDEASLASGREARLYKGVTRINVACGGHAGSETTMAEAVRLARAAGVVVGAHPSFPDRENFGRRVLTLAPGEVTRFVAEQVKALLVICRAQRVALDHVKPHGALYNACASDESLARAIAEGVRQVSPSLALVGLAGSPCLEWWRKLGFRVLGEGFADRRYQKDGTLVPRSSPGAVLTDPEEAVAQASLLLQKGKVRTETGELLSLACDTVCVHGDNAAAEKILDALARSH